MSPAPQDPLVFRGLLAIELRDTHLPQHPALSGVVAGEVATLLGRDIAKLVPGVLGCELGLLGVHYDPAEVLRPGWPRHQALLELLDRRPKDEFHASAIGFGADAAGELPELLRADPDYSGGVLRVLPFVLRGAPIMAARAALEDELFDRGLAEPDVALLLIDGLDTRFEHVRYQSLHDLLAMTAMQYQHVGLDALWALVEAALLDPASTQLLDQPQEPLVRVSGGQARVAMLDFTAWHRHHADLETDPARLERGFALFEMRQRQYAAVLRAHGVPVEFVHCPDGDAACLQ